MVPRVPNVKFCWVPGSVAIATGTAGTAVENEISGTPGTLGTIGTAGVMAMR
jgi:hypothetical protein